TCRRRSTISPASPSRACTRTRIAPCSSRCSCASRRAAVASTGTTPRTIARTRRWRRCSSGAVTRTGRSRRSSGSRAAARSSSATPPAGEPPRLDPCRAQVAARLIPQLALADSDPHLGDALDRWELSLFQDDPFRGEQLRHALDAALGEGDGTWAAAMRAAALLNETDAEPFRKPAPDLVRRTLVAILEHGDRAALLRELDAKLLGTREKAA